MVFIYFDCKFGYLYRVSGNIKHRPPCNITCEKSYIAGSEKTEPTLHQKRLPD